MKILFSGMIAADPWQGGATWAVLQYVLGLQRLGHQVTFVEPVPPAKITPAGSTLAESTNAEYFRFVTGQFGLAERAALLLTASRQCVGMHYERLIEEASKADVLINVSGMLRDADMVRQIPVRIFLDLDPAFVQLWHATQGIDMGLEAHTHFVTVGLNLGKPDCTVPTCGKQWITILPPVVLEHWPVVPPATSGPITTVGNWRGYGSIHHEGVHYGQRAHSFRAIFSLPSLVGEKLSPALAIDAGEVPDQVALADNGWVLDNPREVAREPASYRRYIQFSKAELSIPKSGYVVSRCGWFSDRSACYLASGRPVIAQDTGLRGHLPCENGLILFNNLDDLVGSIEELNRDYLAHCRAARRLAEQFFDSDIVLQAVLERTIGVHA